MADEKDLYYMGLALEQAKIAASLGETPVGAVLVWEDRVVAQTCNRRELDKIATAHAELLAIRRASAASGDWRLNNCTLYVTLEPCPMCAGAIVMADVASVIYGAADEQAGCAGSVYALPEDPAFGKKIPCMGGLMADECREMLGVFFEERRI